MLPVTSPRPTEYDCPSVKRGPQLARHSNASNGTFQYDEEGLKVVVAPPGPCIITVEIEPNTEDGSARACYFRPE